MMNVLGNQAPAKKEKMLTKFENSYTKTAAKQSMSSKTPLWNLPGDLNRKSERALHCREVCSPILDK
jgi:hypothetical protein